MRRRDVKAVQLFVACGDRLTQFRCAEGIRVGQWAPIAKFIKCCEDARRRTGIRFAEAEFDDIVTLCCEASGLGGDAHRVEGLEIAGALGQSSHAAIVPTPSSFVSSRSTSALKGEVRWHFREEECGSAGRIEAERCAAPWWGRGRRISAPRYSRSGELAFKAEHRSSLGERNRR